MNDCINSTFNMVMHMPKLKKAKNFSLVADVTRQIEEAILDGEYRSGDKLPSTRKLQDIFGASLGTIRESLAILEQKGLLSVRKGSKGGFFIREITTTPMANSIELLMRHMVLSPRELYEFRATVEAGLIRLVVQKASDDQIQHFGEYLDRFTDCLNQGHTGWIKFIEIEQDLRREFLHIIKNRTYEMVLIPIINNLQKYAHHHLPGSSQETKSAYEYWKKIIPTVAERDEDRAASLITELLFHFMDLILDHAEKKPMHTKKILKKGEPETISVDMNKQLI